MLNLNPDLNIVLYGTGASARYFIEQYSAQCNIVALTDSTAQVSAINDLTRCELSDIERINFDFIVVASWAISDICKTLSQFDIQKSQILWFQHNKNKLVPADHPDALESHQQLDAGSTLYAFYDLDVSRATFDILGFLCLADLRREELGCISLHVVIVNASNNQFNIAARGIINTSEHIWRKRQILAQSCGLIEACSGVTFTSYRDEAQYLSNKAEYIFPDDYRASKPVACWEFDNLFRQSKCEKDISRLKASPQAIDIVRRYLTQVNPDNKQVICITLRHSEIKPARNSNIPAWKEFISQLDEKIYIPVVLPDTEDSWNSNLTELNAAVFTEACFNVELRMALYELSYINLGVNNGPMHLCALSPTCRYLMYKQVTEDYAHTSTQSFIDRGFTIGAGFPGANFFQRLVWENDDVGVIKASFEKLANDINV